MRSEEEKLNPGKFKNQKHKKREPHDEYYYSQNEVQRAGMGLNFRDNKKQESEGVNRQGQVKVDDNSRK